MKFFLSALLFFIFYQNNEIQIKNIKNIYNWKDVINCTIINYSKKEITYSINLEKEKIEWREIIGDLSNPISKSTRLFVLKPFTKKNFLFHIKKLKVLRNNINKDNNYRIGVTYKKEKDTIKYFAFSNSFTVIEN